MRAKPLSTEYQTRVLGYAPSTSWSPSAKRRAIDLLKPHGMLDAVDPTDVVELPLPDFAQAFDVTASAALDTLGRRWLDKLERLHLIQLEAPRSYPSVDFKGWYQYKGDVWQHISKLPDGLVGIFDFETVEVASNDWRPSCCVIMSDQGWFIWVADRYSFDETVVSFGHGHLLGGFNVSYDRSFVKEEYHFKDSNNRFFDLMSAFIAVRGQTNQMKAVYRKFAKEQEDGYCPQWMEETAATHSLADAYEHYFHTQLDKGVRESIVDDASFTREHLDEVVRYCLLDVVATAKLNYRLYPEWKVAQPSLISRYSQLQLGSLWLPLSQSRWYDYYDKADALYNQTLNKLNQQLRAKADEVLAHPTKHQLAELDWTPSKSGKNKGKPAWWRSIQNKLTLTMRVVPLLLGVTWRDELVFWDGDTFRTKSYDIPHPTERGKRVTCLFVKGFSTAVETGTLAAPGMGSMLDDLISCINWKQFRERAATIKTEDVEGYPVCVPRIAVTGTVTRRCADSIWLVAANPKEKRIGTELKSMIEAPPGYKVVGADIDSEELWLFASTGDTITGYPGSTPLSLMTLIGDKEQRTDPHSKLADAHETTRDLMKNFIYGAIYGQGVKGGADYLAKARPMATYEACRADSTAILGSFKGVRGVSGAYTGGLGSDAFNYCEDLADHPHPRTPILKAAMSIPLAGNRDFKPTRVNWGVQSMGCDMRDLLVLYTYYFFKKMNVDARLAIFIHDEPRYICLEKHAVTAAYCIQLAHLYATAYITDALGLNSIPANRAWHSSVDIDSVIRKSPKATCITPSQPTAIPPGRELTPRQLLTLLLQ